MNNILIAGAGGRMGRWFCEILAEKYSVGALEKEKGKLEGIDGVDMLESKEDIAGFSPGLFINCTGLDVTIDVFDEILPFLDENCTLCDIASLKGQLWRYYNETNRKFVSVHPMFGPTLANMNDLRGHNMLLIKESDDEGLTFFRSLFEPTGLRIFETSFDEHDKMMASALSVPMLTSLLFASSIESTGVVGGSSFAAQRELAARLLKGDSEIITLILMNSFTVETIESMIETLNEVKTLVKSGNNDLLFKLVKARACDLINGEYVRDQQTQ